MQDEEAESDDQPETDEESNAEDAEEEVSPDADEADEARRRAIGGRRRRVRR
jgi:hypothetical protein